MLIAFFATFYSLSLYLDLNNTSGNGGAFLAALMLALGSFSLIGLTVLGTLTFSLGYFYQDKLPRKVFYHWGLPLTFAVPGYAVSLFIIYQWVVVGI